MRLMYLVSTTGAHCLTCLSKNNVRNALKRGEAYLCVGKKKSHAFTFRIGKKLSAFKTERNEDPKQYDTGMKKS